MFSKNLFTFSEDKELSVYEKRNDKNFDNKLSKRNFLVV